MPIASITFDEVILTLHIIFAIVAFGVVFTWPLVMAAGSRLDPRAMPWLHQMQQLVGRRIVSPGLLLVVVFGVILASEYHAWKLFYVQWGVGAAIVIGAIEGAVLIPRAGRLADIARRDVGAGDHGTVTLSAEYRGLQRQLMLANALVSVIVVLTVYLMVIRAGA